MFDKKVSTIKLNGTEYPYKCDLVVLEKVQTEIGDVIEFEESIRGIEQGEDGEKKYTVPNVAKVCKCLAWMIEEGIEITGQDIEPPSEIEIKRQDDYTLIELALYVFDEYNKCFLSKTGGETKKTNQKKASKKNAKTEEEE